MTHNTGLRLSPGVIMTHNTGQRLSPGRIMTHNMGHGTEAVTGRDNDT